jgi:hypothetical protein
LSGVFVAEKNVNLPALTPMEVRETTQERRRMLERTKNTDVAQIYEL